MSSLLPPAFAGTPTDFATVSHRSGPPALRRTEWCPSESAPAAADWFRPASPQIRFGRAALRNATGAMHVLQERGVLILGSKNDAGRGLLSATAQAAFPANLLCDTPEDGQKTVSQLKEILDTSVRRERLTPDQRSDVHEPACFTWQDMETPVPQQIPSRIKHTGLVLDAHATESPEGLAIQKHRLKKLLTATAPVTPVAVLENHLDLEEFAASLPNPEDRARLVGVRITAPALKSRLVEVHPTSFTRPAILNHVLQFIEALGKVPVLVNGNESLPGNESLTDRFQRTLSLEAMRLYNEGWGTPQEIDRVATRLLWPKSAQSDRLTLTELAPPFRHMMNPANRAAQTLLQNSHGIMPQDSGAHDAGPWLQLPQNWKHALENTLKTGAWELPAPVEKISHRWQKTMPEREAEIQTRLMGSVLVTALQLASRGVPPSDLETVCKLAFKWEATPFRWLKDADSKEVSAVMDRMKTLYGHQTHIPEVSTLNPVPRWVRMDTDGPVCRITMTRQVEYNALGTELLTQLREAFLAAEKNPAIKTIVLGSQGGDVFSAGADLDEIERGMADQNEDTLVAYAGLGRSLMDTIAASSKVTVAEVNGRMFGGGAELALACDYMVAAEDATMCFPEVNLGIVPDWGGTERLAEKVGKPFAYAAILDGTLNFGLKGILPHRTRKALDADARKGTVVPADIAQQLGLIHTVTRRANLRDTVNAMVSEGAFETKPDARRGLSRYASVADYPPAIGKGYSLKEIVETSRKRQGPYSQPAWELAKSLIDKVDTEDRGVITSEELRGVFRQARAKHDAIQKAVQWRITLDNWVILPVTRAYRYLFLHESF